jgi:hypothetical protein
VSYQIWCFCPKITKNILIIKPFFVDLFVVISNFISRTKLNNGGLMQYFKTLDGMIRYILFQEGALDDEGKPIMKTEQPMTEDEHCEYQRKVVSEQLAQFVPISKAKDSLCG